MYLIKKKERLNPTVTLMEIDAPFVAKKAQAGQFIILRVDEEGERIPLTVADYDREAGTVTIIFQIVGATTKKLDAKEEGDYISDFVGPLGTASAHGRAQKGCRYRRRRGLRNRLSGCEKAARAGRGGTLAWSVSAAKTSLSWRMNSRRSATVFNMMTDDGSYGEKGLVTDALQQL